MARTWTFGQKIGAGFAVTVALALVIGGVSIYALKTVVAAKDSVITVDAANIADAERLARFAAERTAAGRAFLLSSADRHLEDLRAGREDFVALFGALRKRVSDPWGFTFCGAFICFLFCFIHQLTKFLFLFIRNISDQSRKRLQYILATQKPDTKGLQCCSIFDLC